VHKVDVAAGTAPSTPLLVGYQTTAWGSQMPETFHWNMELLQGKTYAERAKECLRVAQVCPKYLKESYLEMAAEYEQRAKETKKSAQEY
jgi:hypothetical protein